MRPRVRPWSCSGPGGERPAAGGEPGALAQPPAVSEAAVGGPQRFPEAARAQARVVRVCDGWPTPQPSLAAGGPRRVHRGC